MQNPLSLVSIQQVIRRKSYKDNIDKLKIDLKSLLNPQLPRYTNLLFAPSSQRLLPHQPHTTELKANTACLRQATQQRRRPTSKSKEKIIKTQMQSQTKPTHEGSYGEAKMPKDTSKVTTREQSRQSTKYLLQQNKTLNAFLFKIEFPENTRANTTQTKKRIRYVKEPEGLDKGELEAQQRKFDSTCSQQQFKLDLPRVSRKDQKIPDFIRVNLELEKSGREVPKASIIYAERKAKSVIRFRKKKNQERKEISKQAQRAAQQRQRIRAHYQNSQQYQRFARFATIQPEVSQVRLVNKCQTKQKRKDKSLDPLRLKSYVQKHKRKLRTEKRAQQADICGWNNQENQDNFNFL